MPVQLRRGVNADRTSITPEIGELIFCTDTKKIWVGDGATAGGVEINDTTYQNLYNVKLYGAAGDGVTDDTSSIQDAIDACSIGGGGVVYFPPGIYVIIGGLSVDYSSGSASQIDFLGTGKHTSRLLLSASGTEDLLTFDCWRTAARSFRIDGLGFSLSSGTGGNGIVIKNGSRGEISNCYVYGFSSGAGVKMDADTGKNSDLNRIVGTYIGACQDGVWLDCSGVSSSYCDAHMISGCRIVSNTQYDIRCTNTGGIAGKANAHFIGDTWVQCLSTGTHGLYIEDDVSAVKVCNSNFDGSTATTCITISASSTYTLIANTAVDGGFVDNSGAMELVNSHFTASGQEDLQDYTTTTTLRPSAAPGSPFEGMVYYDSVAKKLKVYNGASWETITST